MSLLSLPLPSESWTIVKWTALRATASPPSIPLPGGFERKREGNDSDERDSERRVYTDWKVDNREKVMWSNGSHFKLHHADISPLGGATEYQPLHHSINRQVANMVTKNDANLALTPTFRCEKTSQTRDRRVMDSNPGDVEDTQRGLLYVKTVELEVPGGAWYRLRCRPRHVTEAQNYEASRQ
ncbi:hypothetical protein TNCV_1003841 [Trichonephila clavipes]|nr:hypothetical protein TNCV_1003841 [Trichonephila clavipes]